MISSRDVLSPALSQIQGEPHRHSIFCVPIRLYMAYCVTPYGYGGLMDATVKSAAWKTLAPTSTVMFVSINSGINNYSPMFHILWGIYEGFKEGDDYRI